MQPKLIQTYLPDGTLEGIREIELGVSIVKAYVIPRLKLADAKKYEKLSQPALYFLINTESQKAYIGESENFAHRAYDHEKNKDWWDIAVVIVSMTNNLTKTDVKYLESIAVERSRGGSMDMENKTIPARNTVHEFQLHVLNQILDDTQLVLTLLGYDVLSQPHKQEQIWYCKSKKTDARAVFRGDKFVVLAGSIVDASHTESWAKGWPYALEERNEIFTKYGNKLGDVYELVENVSFRSPNHAGGFLRGSSTNAWVAFRDENGRTMDEVMRKER